MLSVALTRFAAIIRISALAVINEHAVGTHGDDCGPDPIAGRFSRPPPPAHVVHGAEISSASVWFGMRMSTWASSSGGSCCFGAGRVEDHHPRAMLFRHPGDVFDHRHRNFELHEDVPAERMISSDRAEFFGNPARGWLPKPPKSYFPAVVYKIIAMPRCSASVRIPAVSTPSRASEATDSSPKASFPHFGDHPSRRRPAVRRLLPGLRPCP